MKCKLLATAALCLVLIATIALIVALPALADSTYHSEHITLMSANGAPLKAGFVENIHVNGPRVFALERYVLVGAMPNTQYQVTIQIYLNADKTVYAGALPTIAFWTNRVGNGVGHFTLPPSGAAGFHGMTLYLVWELSAGGVVKYATPLTTVTLD